MGNKRAQGRLSARRVATFLAAIGALVMSSGIALMVTATPANAAQKVTFCHSTGSESNPWVKLTTDVHSFYNGHVLAQHTSDIYPAVTFTQGKKTISVKAQGTEEDMAFLANGCKAPDSEPGDLVAAATVGFTDPTCAEPTSGDVSLSADNADFTVDPDQASYAIGDSVTVTANADQGAAFADGAQTSWSHTFQASDGPCTSQVNPPKVKDDVVVKTPKQHTKTKATVTPTVVHAGLAGSTTDLRGEQGLALVFAGMVMLLAAGGLGLRVRSAAQRF